MLLILFDMFTKSSLVGDIAIRIYIRTLPAVGTPWLLPAGRTPWLLTSNQIFCPNQLTYCDIYCQLALIFFIANFNN